MQRKLADANPTVVEFQAELSLTHNNIGNLLFGTGQTAEALKAYESALTIGRKLAREHAESPFFACELGATLNNLATIDLRTKQFQRARVRLREAVEWQRKALAAYPAHPTFRRYLGSHFRNLRDAAQGLGDSAGVAEAERELANLRNSDPAILAFDNRLAAVVKGTEQPKNEADRFALARRAYDKKFYATAARLWAEAITINPKLGDDRKAEHRYNAACAAVLAGVGKGNDDPQPDLAARAKLRNQALECLKLEHAAWSNLLESDSLKAGPLVAKTLVHWQKDADLAGIRDAKEIARLPEAERPAFKQLWSDIDSLLTKARVAK